MASDNPPKRVAVLRGFGSNVKGRVLEIMSDPPLQSLGCSFERRIDVENRINKIYGIMHVKYTRVDEPIVFLYAYQPIYINGHQIFRKRPVALYRGAVISVFSLENSFVYIPEDISYFHGSRTDVSVFKTFDLGKYKLMRLPVFLGSGAESHTYLTVRPDRPSLQLVCKVKDIDFLRPRSRRKEMELLQKAKHSNIVKLIHYEETPKNEYFITPLAAGGTLQERLDEAKRSELRKTCSESILFIFYQILFGLLHLHSLKPIIIHGDIKPANILLSGNSDFPHVVVGDLGVSVPKDKADCLRSCGSVAYHSPERIKEEFGPLDEKCDVWSAGVILYQMITSRYPFGHHSSIEKLRQHIVEQEPSFHGSIWSQIDSIRTMSRNLLRKKPAERPTVQETIRHGCLWLIGNLQKKHGRVIDDVEHERELWEKWDDSYTVCGWNTFLEDIEGTRAKYQNMHPDTKPDDELLKFANGEDQFIQE